MAQSINAFVEANLPLPGNLVIMAKPDENAPASGSESETESLEETIAFRVTTSIKNRFYKAMPYKDQRSTFLREILERELPGLEEKFQKLQAYMNKGEA
jgi:hypothetical protein